MVPRITGLAILTLLSVYATAQQGKIIKIKFASEGEREVWIQKGPNPTEPDAKQTVSGKSIELEIVDDGKGMIVCVHEVASGKVGFVKLTEVLKLGEWVFDPAQSKIIYNVGFMIKHKGEPVASALVKVSDDTGDRETLLTPADKGLATFTFVPEGEVTVTVNYKSDGKSKSLPKQTFIASGGDTPFPLTINDPVETIEPEANSKASPDKIEEAPTKAPANPAATAVNMLLGIVIIGGIGYAIYRYVAQNPAKTAAALGRAGVPIGDPNDPNSGQIKQTGPPKQIILDDATPTPTTSHVSVGLTVKNPRLVKADGSIQMIMEGTQSVGRGENTDLPHPGETSMSRNHASLQRTGESITINDAGSTNGTFVNGRKITDSTPLYPGDTVQFGAVQYRYEE